jgi:hypothetical protein
MAKVKFRGFMFDDRTVEMIKWAEKKAGFKFRITQGSYNQGSVAASAGTHDGGGAVDISVKWDYRFVPLTAKRRNKMLRALKDAGFAAWYRTMDQGFTSDHIHGIAIGCKDLPRLASSQVVAYDANRTGLKSNGPDYSYRPDPKVQFDMAKKQPVSREKKAVKKTATATKKVVTKPKVTK